MNENKKENSTRRRNTNKLLNTLWAKPHKVSASVTEEHDWHTEVPNVKLARVFGIVLVLHIVAVGGILAFKMIEKNSVAALDDSAAVEEPKVSSLTDDASDATTKGADDIKIDTPFREGLQHYRVRSGDNLLAVARKLGVSISELEELNNLHRGNNLYTGQVLLVPNRKLSTLPPDELQRLLKQPEGAAPGPVADAPTPAIPEKMAQVLPPADAPAVVKKPAVEAPLITERPAPKIDPAPTPKITQAPTPTPPAPEPTASTKSYVVQQGDTPYGLARKFGTTHEALMRLNGISDPRLLKVGQEIRIP